MRLFSRFTKIATSFAIATLMAISGFQGTPAQATSTTLTWSNIGSVPVAGGSGIVTLKFGHNIFMAVATNGDVLTSSDGATWATVGNLGGPTPPNAAYKADLAFGLSGTPVAPDSGVAGTPTWVFTSKDNMTVWTSTNDGATWTVTAHVDNYLKKVAYGDGHFIIGYTYGFKTSTNGIDWHDAGNGGSRAGDAEGRIAFGNHTFVIPITYSNTICRRSTINWVNNANFDCSSALDVSGISGTFYEYWGQTVFGNGIFVGPLDGGSARVFWTSSDGGATWVRGISSTTQPVGLSYGRGFFVMDKSGGTTAFSRDGITWTETGSRPGGGSGMLAYGNGKFIGLGGSGNSMISAGVLSQTEPGTPVGVAGSAGNASVDLSWTAPADDGGSAVTYTATSTPGGLTCTTTSTSCRVTGLTNGTSYTFSVTATNSVGSSASSSATSALTPVQPVPNAPTGLAGVVGNSRVDLTWTASPENGGGTNSYTVTSTPGSFTCTTTTTSCRIAGLTNGTTYTFTVTATNIAGPSSASSPSSDLVPAVPVQSVSAGSTPNSQLVSIPEGLSAATIPATTDLPSVSLAFAATSGSASATVAPIENPASASATPFKILGSTKIVDISVTGVTGPVTLCLDGGENDHIFHFTGGAWVELPQRTYANGQVCGVTESFSPFAAAEFVPKSTIYTGPKITGRLDKVASTSGGSLFTITGDRLAQVTSVSLEGKPLTVVSKSESAIVVKLPEHTAGFADLTLKGDSATLVYQAAIEFKTPVVTHVPVVSTKSILVASGSSKALTAAQQTSVKKFVASANAGAVLSCSATYTSKVDLQNAKGLAAATCSAAKKANSGLATRVTAPMLVKAKSAQKILLSLSN
jgi:hypothetical protein